MKELAKKCESCGGQIDINTMQEVVVCPYCENKYVISELLDESENIRIEKIRVQAYKEMEENRKKDEIEQQKLRKEQMEIELFTKSKFRCLLIFFTIFAVLVCTICFKDGKIFAALVAGGSVIAFVSTYLLRINAIKSKSMGMNTITTALAFVLLVIVFALY